MAVRSGAVLRQLHRHAAELAGRSWSWQEEAACRKVSVDLFFGPEQETPTQRRERESAAARVCGACPVKDPCRSHALSLPEAYGVWGGTSEDERSRRSVATSAA